MVGFLWFFLSVFSLPDVLKALHAALTDQGTISFPPVLIASDLATLVAQCYVSNHPLSGMILISPPISNGSDDRVLSRFSSSNEPADSTREFTFEPTFPLLIIDRDEIIQRQILENRLIRGGADCVGVGDGEVEDRIGEWLDYLGI